MAAYSRPVLPPQVFYDGDGKVIDYGTRWRDRSGMPAEETYSVCSHPERFAPVHAVARALIEYLADNYDATITDDLAAATDLMHPPDEVAQAIRVTPANAGGAPLTFVFTTFPGVILHAGLLHDFPVPQCGCDACDETAASAADELESIVLAVVAGDYKEAFRSDIHLGISYAISHGDTRRSGRRSPSVMDSPERLQDATARLSRLPDGWEPWKPRD